MKVSLLPTLGTRLLAVLVSDRLMTDVMLSVSLAVLLPGVGSITPAGVDTVATLLTEPPVAVTFATMANVTVPPLGRVAIVTPAPSSSATVSVPGHTAPPVAPVQLRPVLVKPVASTSLSSAPSAALGPALLTTTV